MENIMAGMKFIRSTASNLSTLMALLVNVPPGCVVEEQVNDCIMTLRNVSAVSIGLFLLFCLQIICAGCGGTLQFAAPPEPLRHGQWEGRLTIGTSTSNFAKFSLQG